MPRTKKAKDNQELVAIAPYLDVDALAALILNSPEWQDVAAQLDDAPKAKIYPTDPVEFTRDVLGYQMWPKLEEICYSVRDHHNTVVESCFGAGKSVICASLAMHWLCTHDPAVVVTIAPTFAQIQGIIWAYIRDKGRKAGLPGTILEAPRWKITDARWAVGVSPRRANETDLASLQGRHNPNLLVIMDEAAGLPRAVWDVVQGLAVGGDNRIIAVGNPIEQSGPFWDATNHENWHHIRISALDHPNVISGTETIPGAVTREWVNDRCKDWATECSAGMEEAVYIPWQDRYYKPLPIFMAKVLGIAPEQAEDQLIKLSWVIDAQQRVIDVSKEQIVVGVDCAPRGGDDNILCTRQGHQVRPIKRMKGQDTQELAEWLALEMRSTGAAKAYIDDVGCFDAKTEILTKAGWKFFTDVTLDDELLSMNPDGFEAFYTKPTQLYQYQYSGPMVTYDKFGSTIDFCVTPNHNMFFRGEKGKSWKIAEFQDIDINHIRMKRDFHWAGKEVTKFVIPSVTKTMTTLKKGTNKNKIGNYTLREYQTDDIVVDMDHWLAFLGWVLSEGNTYKGRGGQYFVCITQKNKDNINIIDGVLRDLGLPYAIKWQKSKSAASFQLYSKQLYTEVRSYGEYCGVKCVPQYVKELSPRQIRIFLDAYLLGDGWVHKGNNGYSTSSKIMADDLQELILKCNNYASVSKHGIAGDTAMIEGRVLTRSGPMYNVNEWRKPTTVTMQKSWTRTVDYDGMVYCATVEPYHLIFTRRNGKCLWTGNSGAGTTDKARRMGLPVMAVNFARRASQAKRFANLRAECYWTVRELLREGKMQLPADPMLLADLTAPKYAPDPYGRILIESKDDIRNRLGRSPDAGDGLALSYAVPITEASEELENQQRALIQESSWAGSRWLVRTPSARHSRWRK